MRNGLPDICVSGRSPAMPDEIFFHYALTREKGDSQW